MKNAPYGVVYLTEKVWQTSVEMEKRAKLRLERLDVYVENSVFKGGEVKSIPNLNYTKEQLDILNKYETSLGKNITSWLVNRITSKSSPTESDWQNNLLKTNRTSIEEVKRVNQAAYDKYLEAINK